MPKACYDASNGLEPEHFHPHHADPRRHGGGKPCIRGMRVTVAMIVGQIGAGLGFDELLADYPYLERADVLEAPLCGLRDLLNPRSIGETVLTAIIAQA